MIRELISNKILDHLIEIIKQDLKKKYIKLEFEEIYKYYDHINSYNFKKEIIELDKGHQIKDYDKPMNYTEQQLILESLKEIIELKTLTMKDIKEIRKYNKDYNTYPSYKENNFTFSLTDKKEFNQYMISEADKNNISCSKRTFELSPHQLFIKSFISKNTPYNGILLFHGVGTGKTCSGVSIAENFKDIYTDKKNIILSSKNIRSGWKNTIWNPKNDYNSCTGDTYIKESKYNSKTRTKTIKKYYELYGYLSFANKIKKLISNNYSGIKKIEYEKKLIRQKYSNRVLIIDEVHNIRDKEVSEKGEEDLDKIEYIQKVLQYSENLKLVLLTANPMYNVSNEIISILNLLLLNDNRPMIKENEIFSSNGDLLISEDGKEIGKERLVEKLKGYVSYIRGENPITFPLRIMPSIFNDDHVVNKMNYPKNIISSNNIKNKLNFLELYGSSFKFNQKDHYMQTISELDLNDDELIQIMDRSKLLQISNMVYPLSDGKLNYGDEGLHGCFSIRKNKKNIKYTCKNETIDFLECNKGLEKYACKINTIIEQINNSDGIVFIYTNFISSGVIPLILALEYNGYKKYNSESILNYPEYEIGKQSKCEPISYDGYRKSDVRFKDETFHQATYAVITGSDDNLNIDIEDDLKNINDIKNKLGKTVKVIIGTTAASEGLDFKYIRCIHILEPWYHLNKLEQVIGRGIRFCSHKDLEECRRNVSIYLHSSTLGDDETIEQYLYRYSETKAKQIGEIETILKQNAIDRFLFHRGNIYTKGQNTRVLPCDKRYWDESWYEILNEKENMKNNRIGKKYIKIDKPYSRICSFQDECDYLNDQLVYLNDRKIIDDTFRVNAFQSEIFMLQKKIVKLFESEICYKLDYIKDKLSDIFDINGELLEYTLLKMCTEKLIFSSNGIEGYLIKNENYFVFQPCYLNDHSISTYYRINMSKQYETEIILPKYKGVEWNPPIIYTIEMINTFLNDILFKNLSSNNRIIKTINEITKDKNMILKLFLLYKIDRLGKDELHMLHTIILVYIRDKAILEDKIKIQNKYLEDNILDQILYIIFDCIKENYISFNGNFEHNYENPIGFLIYDYDTIKKEGKPGFYNYEDDELFKDGCILSPQRVNEVDKRKIMLYFLKKKDYYKELYSTNKSFGYIIYNFRKMKYLFKCDLDGVSTSKFPDPGPGKIVNEEVPGWYLQEIISKFASYDILKKYYEILTSKYVKKYLESDEISPPKDNYLLLLEIILRIEHIYNNDNSFLYFNRMWLKYL